MRAAGRWSGRSLATAAVAALAVALVVPATDAGAGFGAVTGHSVVAGPVALRMGTRATAPGGSWRAVLVDGRSRRYVLATVAGRSPRPSGPTRRPLLILLHGLNQHTVSFLAATQVIAAARRQGVVVAAPETPDASWNDGRFGVHGRDDDGFVLAIIATLARQGLIDRSEVTLAGFSNGAGMAMEVAARHPHDVAALVSVCGTLLAAPGAPRPDAPLEAVFLHGDRDRVQPWGGRLRRSPRMPAQIGEPATVDAFRAADQLGTAPPTVTVLPRRVGSRSGPVTRLTWVSGDGGPSVTLYRVAGAGHTWPALAGQAGPGTLPTDVSATSVMVATAAAAGSPEV